MALYTDVFNVQDVVSLAALTSGLRDGSLRFVRSNNTWYSYSTTSRTAFEDIIITSASGHWVKTANRVLVKTAKPTGIPPFPGITWVANLDNPGRKVIYISTDTGWKPQQTEALTIEPYFFTPDYAGQMTYYSGRLFIAESTYSPDSWIDITSGGGQSSSG